MACVTSFHTSFTLRPNCTGTQKMKLFYYANCHDMTACNISSITDSKPSFTRSARSDLLLPYACLKSEVEGLSSVTLVQLCLTRVNLLLLIQGQPYVRFPSWQVTHSQVVCPGACPGICGDTSMPADMSRKGGDNYTLYILMHIH